MTDSSDQTRCGRLCFGSILTGIILLLLIVISYLPTVINTALSERIPLY
ncbi:MAG: hypothetical protein HQL54_06825 [Magnetococcales bacterium]|nr:hypothetical protein [Magnetococcales bacterium]